MSRRRFYTCPLRNFEEWERRTQGSTTARRRTTPGTHSVRRRRWKSVSVKKKSESEWQRSPSENKRSLFIVRSTCTSQCKCLLQLAGYQSGENKIHIVVRYNVETVSVMLQMTLTSLGSSSSPVAQSYSSSVLSGPFVTPWSADAFIKKATVKTSKFCGTRSCFRSLKYLKLYALNIFSELFLNLLPKYTYSFVSVLANCCCCPVVPWPGHTCYRDVGSPIL